MDIRVSYEGDPEEVAAWQPLWDVLLDAALGGTDRTVTSGPGVMLVHDVEFPPIRATWRAEM